MIGLTILSRVSDGLILCESTNQEGSALGELRAQAKTILKNLSGADPKCTVEASKHNFHYLIDRGVCYLCVSDKSFPRTLAFGYLDEVCRDFYAKHQSIVDTVQRPYAFINYEPAIHKIRNTFRDTKSRHNIQRLNDELHNVTQIMTKNIQSVMERGEKIDRKSS